MSALAKVECPCCGYRTLSKRGDDEICQVCYWHDDGQDDPKADEVWGGPNKHLSLSQARTNFRLLVVRRGAATLFLWVAAASALRNLAAVGFAISAASFFAFWTVGSGAGGFLIDLVLVIVVAVSDRSAYSTPAVSDGGSVGRAA